MHNGEVSTSLSSFGIDATIRILQKILWSPVCVILLSDRKKSAFKCVVRKNGELTYTWVSDWHILSGIINSLCHNLFLGLVW